MLFSRQFFFELEQIAMTFIGITMDCPDLHLLPQSDILDAPCARCRWKEVTDAPVRRYWRDVLHPIRLDR